MSMGWESWFSSRTGPIKKGPMGRNSADSDNNPVYQIQSTKLNLVYTTISLASPTLTFACFTSFNVSKTELIIFLLKWALLSKSLYHRCHHLFIPSPEPELRVILSCLVTFYVLLLAESYKFCFWMTSHTYLLSISPPLSKSRPRLMKAWPTTIGPSWISSPLVSGTQCGVWMWGERT